MEKKLNEIIRNPTKGRQLKKLLPDVNFIRYNDLKNFFNIEDVLSNNACIILYEDPNGIVGHWTCLTKRNDTIEYFDPYGFKVDYYDIDYPYLTELLLKTDYKLEYNPYKFQTDSRDIATCGRHVIVRVSLKNLTINQYYNFLKSFKTDYDALVSLTTHFI